MANKKLKDYFPTLKTRAEILCEIENNPKLHTIFNSWSEAVQQDFLDFCTGQRGVKILYDSFFKEVLNPEYAPERLNSLLSAILRTPVRILNVLPLDSTRMGDETSLVTMDIVVELADKSIVNIEIQKIGYYFPGQRSSCYSSDLILRQYKRIRDTEKNFSYNLIKPVYTIVFFEQSPKAFKIFPNDYIHFFKQQSDTGVELELLQRYIFISLDIFKHMRKNIENELDAWLTFLSSEEPEDILYLIENFPEFKPMYETLFNLCNNIEEVMGMFSEELYELDRNTAKFMVDDLTEQVKHLKDENSQLNDENSQLNNEVSQLLKKIAVLEAKMANSN